MKVVTFGEVMGRLTPDGFQRLGQALPGSLNVTFAGAEANVAASLAILGAKPVFVTALPNNVLADTCVGSLRQHAINVDHILRRDEGRLGLYFLETGSNQRASQVVYDRSGSTISLTNAGEYDWPAILQDAKWFHTTGITPAISRHAADATIAAARHAQQLGIPVSCDLNFRKKLWQWDPSTKPRELAEQTMRQLLPLVDLVIANEEDCGDVLSIRAGGTDVESGHLSVDRYPEVARQLSSQFPNVRRVAITLRESISASHNNWGGMLFDVANDTAHFAPMEANRYQPYAIKNIVDRVGAGDSFGAGLIFGLNTPELSEPRDAIHFAVASSCLAHSIVGDFNYSTREEVERLMGGSVSGRVIR